MRRILFLAWATAGVLVFTIHLGRGWQAAEEPANPEAVELLSTLLREHPYVLDSTQTGSYDEILRRLRELETGQVANWREANRAVETRLSDTSDKILEDLGGSPFLISLSPDDFQTVTPESDQREFLFLERREPVRLPGDLGVLLVRVDLGGPATRYQVAEYDLAQRSYQTVELEPDAVHWVLANLKNVPVGRTFLRFQFDRANEPPLRYQLPAESPKPGRLKVRVLSDDTGQPIPAMVHLLWKTTNRERMPGNAVDFAPQFDNQGSATARRGAILPGKMGGLFWWCVSGPFDTMLPPGEWELKVRRGLEHVPESLSFSVESGATVEKTIRPRRWVNMPQRGWYSGDDHVHARILSDRDALHIMHWAQAEDIHLSNIVKMGDIQRTYFEQRGFGKDFRTLDGDYILSPGQECPRTHNELGHTISMNITEMVRDTDQYYLYDWLFDNVHEQGGLAGYCHVLNNAFHVHRDMSINVPKGKVDFVELLQFGRLGTELYYDFLNTGFKLTASAGSDVPWGGTVGEVRLYAYLGDSPFSADAWFEAVGRGRTFVTNGPMIEFTVDTAWPGDELRLASGETGRQLRVRARAWGDSRRMTPTRLEIVRHGEVIEEVVPAVEGQSELSLDFTVDPADGFWIAARAGGSDGSQAHTTPIYVIRGPLRFWKYETVGELIAMRLESLAEVDQIVADARRATSAGQATYPVQQLARQGDALLERVTEARRIYHELQQAAETERELRR